MDLNGAAAAGQCFGLAKRVQMSMPCLQRPHQHDWLGPQKPWIHPERVPWVADYAYGELPSNMPFLYVWFVVNSGETSKGSIPSEQLWVVM